MLAKYKEGSTLKNCTILVTIFVLLTLGITTGCGSTPLTTSNATVIVQTKENLNLTFIYDLNDPIREYEPIINLTVYVYCTNNSSPNYTETTDSDGRIYLNEIPKGEYGIIIADESWIRVSTIYIDHSDIKSDITVLTFLTSQYDNPEYGIYLKKK
ncbi:MAG: hypothetical protein ACD_58C00039G0007 [uncultured bacterium]|nr:MAG: hypothetical protein ACD_58C00039G0007 [uncultured bacterium]